MEKLLGILDVESLKFVKMFATKFLLVAIINAFRSVMKDNVNNACIRLNNMNSVCVIKRVFLRF